MNTFAKITSIFYSDQEKQQIKDRLLDYVKRDSSGKLIKIPQERDFLDNTILKKYIEDYHKDLCINERTMHKIEIDKCIAQYRMNGLSEMPDMTKAHEYDNLYINSIKKTDIGKKIINEINEIPNQDIINILAIHHGNLNDSTEEEQYSV